MENDLQQEIAALAQGDLAARVNAARRLAQTATTPPDATAELVRALDGPFVEELFPWIEAALEKIEAPPVGQTDQLTAIIDRFLHHSIRPDAAYWAATMLGRIGRNAASAIPALIALLDRVDHPNIQFKAAWALGKIGPAAKPAVPHLARAAANSGHPRLATFARQALEEIDR